MAIETDIEFFRDDDITLSVQMNPVVDITGWTISMVVKGPLKTSAALFTIAGVLGADPALGDFTVAIADTDTHDVTIQDYFYDIRRTDTGSEAVLAYGRLTLLQEIGP